MFRALLEQASEDTNKKANAVRYKSDRIDLRVKKSLQSADNAKKNASKKSKGVAKSEPFPSVELPQPTAANTTQQVTPCCAVGSQLFTSKGINDIRNDYLQKQSEPQPIKPQSPYKSFWNE